MSILAHYTLPAQTVHQQVLSRLQTHLSVEAEGYRCTTAQVLSVLVKAVAQKSSIEAVCADHPTGVSSNSVRQHLHAAFAPAQLREQEAEVNRVLAGQRPPSLP